MYHPINNEGQGQGEAVKAEGGEDRAAEASPGGEGAEGPRASQGRAKETGLYIRIIIMLIDIKVMVSD